jgi:hypothetical protein
LRDAQTFLLLFLGGTRELKIIGMKKSMAAIQLRGLVMNLDLVEHSCYPVCSKSCSYLFPCHFFETLLLYVTTDFYLFIEDKDFLQQSNSSKAKRVTRSKPNTTTSISADIATESKPLSVDQTAREQNFI